jgi:hypothetical protein
MPRESRARREATVAAPRHRKRGGRNTGDGTMKYCKLIILSMVCCLGFSAFVRAGEASTSATASSWGWGRGVASATADYAGGGPGYAKTRTRSGPVNVAQGVALGLDQGGLSFSSSYAVAPGRGPAVAGTLNVNIGLDGQVSTSVGRTVARGDRSRTVFASGGVGPGHGARPATATVTGRTGPRGDVRSFTESSQRRPYPRRAVFKRRPRWGRVQRLTRR